MDIAKAVNEISKEKNISKADVAAVTGIPEDQLDQIWTGENDDPQATLVFMISHAMGVTVDELIDRAM